MSPAERQRHNQFGQPISFDVPDWSPRPIPDPDQLAGRYVCLERLTPAHAPGLHAATCAPGTEARWTYMPVGPFATPGAFGEYLAALIADPGVTPLAIVDTSAGTPLGVATYLRIDRTVGSMEVGSIMYGPALSASRGATEAMFLMMRHTFDDLGYRRYEWKCDALNEPSRRAAVRLGFRFEGVFRQATMYKGRNRDTAWYAVVDHDWPDLRNRFTDWLDPANFDEHGRQRRPLAACG